ncbi:formate/nitrite transporter family protein [Anaerosphaera multitolerans]|uniref:Formate/nitrite transporter family protein n=1 Tax=Anaerosphaera multitolerans TaxID=2487351 RepID=A0A437S911_9FIRM|nr:formate/nitrite transporter family protein [Anaerosphaera multitolerans]RVU55593.1 formate/nitrite transporter family protein [Anaerosphaera multitolerans]
MYSGIVSKLANLSVAKRTLYEDSKFKYLVSSMLAGFHVGVGLLTMCLSIAIFADVSFPIVKLVNGFLFSLALSLVLAAGGDLFTGNVLVLSTGAMNKKVTTGDAVKICTFSYFGNFLGAILLSLVYYATDIPTDGMTDAIINLAISKASYGASALFFKGILCNILVCLGVLVYNKLENEAAKLIMIFWCILPFVALGFEHSVANMTCFTLAKMLTPDFTFAMMIKNLIPVTLGNIVGGFVLAGTYQIMGTKSEKVKN